MAVGGLASARTYPLRSSFRPTYNMAVNLVAQVGREVAREILETLLRPVPGRPRRGRHRDDGAPQRGRARGLRRGDALRPRRLPRVRRPAPVPRRRPEGRGEGPLGIPARRGGHVPRGAEDRRRHPDPRGAAGRLGRRRPAGPRRTGHVIGPGRGHRGQAVPPVDPRRRARAGRGQGAGQGTPALQPEVAQVPPGPRHQPADRHPASHGGLAPVGVPSTCHPASPSTSRRMRAELKAHPCHPCPDREKHARWAERWWRLKRETVGLQRKVEGRTKHRGRAPSTGSARPWSPWDTSRTGAPWSPSVGSACAGSTPRRTCWRPSACAATCGSASTHRAWLRPSRLSCTSPATRRPRCPPRMPNDEVAEAIVTMERLWSGIEDLETEHDLPSASMPDGGMAWMVHRLGLR